MKNRNRKIIKESNAAEWEAIKEQARLEKLAYLIDVNNNSRPSSIDVVNAPDLNELEIEGIVIKYLSKIKKKRTTRLEKLFGTWTKESFLYSIILSSINLLYYKNSI